MSTELIPELDLDIQDPLRSWDHWGAIEKSRPQLVHLMASVENIESIRESLLFLRAENISALLVLRRPVDLVLEDHEIATLFRFLREWDQLILQNFLAICEDWVPKAFLLRLQDEAKLELKWFKEWLSACCDSRIHKYPGLPWRSFIRKIVNENFEFCSQFLELVSLPATEENLGNVQSLFNGFFESKKKVLCVFPKRWGKNA